VTPSGLTLPALGAAYAQTATFSETSYTGTIAVTSTCGGITPIATLSPVSGPGPSLTVTVTGASAGTCTATATDGFGQQSVLSIAVNNYGVIINAAKGTR
jgi:hypothetical protein